MKSLTTYIMEATDSSFNQVVHGMNELKEKAGVKLYIFDKEFSGKKEKTKEDKEVLECIVGVFNRVIGQNVIKYSAGEKAFFKAPRELSDEIKNAFICEKIEGVLIKGEGEKIHLYYKGVKLMETGRGSKKDGVKTKDQEDATCLVFNVYMDSVEYDKDFNKIGDLEYIKNVLSEKFPSHSFDNIWLKCFSNQVMSLVDYLYRITGNKNIASYRLVRFDERGRHTEVSRMYTNMVKSYAKIKGMRRDVFDPTDVILFDKNKIDVIKANCKIPSDEESANQIRNNFLENCFKPRICMGVSLKKLSKSGRIKEYNTGSESIESIKSYEIIYPKKPTSKNIMVKCSGKFDLNETTDINKKTVKDVTNIALTLRTFSEGIVAMDATVTNATGSYEGPSLGKCPVNIWRPILGVKKNEYKDIDACMSKFKKFLGVEDDDQVLDGKNKRQVLDGLKELIDGAVKEGPSCFPFILIH